MKQIRKTFPVNKAIVKIETSNKFFLKSIGLIFYFFTLSFCSLQARQSNRLIMLIGGDGYSPLKENQISFLEDAMHYRAAPILCTAAYICSWLDACIEESKKLPPDARNQINNFNYIRNFIFFSSIRPFRWSFYRLRDSDLFLCLPDDHQGFFDLIASTPTFLEKIDLFPLYQQFPDTLTPDIIDRPQKMLKTIINLLVADGIIEGPSFASVDNVTEPVYLNLYHRYKSSSVNQRGEPEVITLYDGSESPLSDHFKKLLLTPAQQVIEQLTLLRKQLKSNQKMTENKTKEIQETIKNHLNAYIAHINREIQKFARTASYELSCRKDSVKKAQDLHAQIEKQSVESIDSELASLIDGYVSLQMPWHIVWLGHGAKLSFFNRVRLPDGDYYTNTLLGNTDIYSVAKTLALFNTIETKSLLFASCFSGGSHRDYFTPFFGHTAYPIVLLSASDEIVSGVGRRDFKKYFVMLEEKLPGTKNGLAWFEQAISELFSFFAPERPENIPMIKPAQSDSFYFFVPGENCIKSLKEIKIDQLSEKQKMALYYGPVLDSTIIYHKQEKKEAIDLPHKKNILISPEIIDLPLIITPLYSKETQTAAFPLLTSLEKGNAAHFLGEIILRPPTRQVASTNKTDFFTQDDYSAPVLTAEEKRSYGHTLIDQFCRQVFAPSSIRKSIKWFFTKKISYKENHPSQKNNLFIENLLVRSEPVGESAQAITMLYKKENQFWQKVLIYSYNEQHTLEEIEEQSVLQLLPERAYQKYNYFTEQIAKERFALSDKKVDSLREQGFRILEDLFVRKNQEFFFDKFYENAKKKMLNFNKNELDTAIIFSFFDFYKQHQKEVFTTAALSLRETEMQKQKLLSQAIETKFSDSIPSTLTLSHALHTLKSKLTELTEQLNNLRSKLLALSDKITNKQKNPEFIKEKLTENGTVHPEFLAELPLLTIKLYQELLEHLKKKTLLKKLEQEDYIKILSMVMINKKISVTDKKTALEITPSLTPLNQQTINQLFFDCLKTGGPARFTTIIKFFHQDYLKKYLYPLTEENKKEFIEIIFNADPPLDFPEDEMIMLLSFIEEYEIKSLLTTINLLPNQQQSNLFLALAIAETQYLTDAPHDIFTEYLRNSEEITEETIGNFIETFRKKEPKSEYNSEKKYLLAFCRNKMISAESKASVLKKFLPPETVIKFLNSYFTSKERAFIKLAEIITLLNRSQSSIQDDFKTSKITAVRETNILIKKLELYLKETRHNFSQEEFMNFLSIIEKLGPKSRMAENKFKEARTKFITALSCNNFFAHEKWIQNFSR